jgi:hypothetical protein
VQELFLQSLEALGLDLTRHDFRFVEDNWQSPSLGAWGLGWEAWLDGMEVLQFTYFQECGGVKCDVRACELTYGVERIAMYLQGVESVYDLKWAPGGITYGDIYHAQEVEYCKYNFEHSDASVLFGVFEQWESEGLRLLDAGLILPAYDHCLRLSHLFNLLDARGALSVTERGRFLLLEHRWFQIEWFPVHLGQVGFGGLGLGQLVADRLDCFAGLRRRAEPLGRFGIGPDEDRRYLGRNGVAGDQLAGKHDHQHDHQEVEGDRNGRGPRELAVRRVTLPPGKPRLDQTVQRAIADGLGHGEPLTSLRRPAHGLLSAGPW